MQNYLINGIKIYAPNNREELMDYAISNQSVLIAVNAEKILHATPKTRELINRNVGYPDGIGAVWALNKKAEHKTVKIPGCELWLDLVARYFKEKSFYFIGGTQEVIEKTIEKLNQDYPGITILNYRNGYIKSDAEKLEVHNDILLKQPDIVFVAMGSPKQELFIEELQSKYAAVYQGLGGSFDVYTGNVKRAPDWWVKNNLEWAYRLINQPSRIKRQSHLIRFFINLHLNKY